MYSWTAPCSCWKAHRDLHLVLRWFIEWCTIAGWYNPCLICRHNRGEVHTPPDPRVLAYSVRRIVVAHDSWPTSQGLEKVVIARPQTRMAPTAVSESTPAKEPSEQKSITLLGLPPEIRVIIWGHVFQDTRLTLRKSTSAKNAATLDVFPTASLLLLHKSIHGETQQLFWECVTLAVQFGDWKAVRLLNQRAKRQGLPAVHNLRLYFYPFWDSVPREELTAFWFELCLVTIRRVYFTAWISYERLPGRGMELSSTKSLFRAFARITLDLPQVDLFVLELRMNSRNIDDVRKIESIAEEEEQCRQAIGGSITFVRFEEQSTTCIPKPAAEGQGTIALFQWRPRSSQDAIK